MPDTTRASALRSIAATRGYRSLCALARQSGIHRETLRDLVQGRRSPRAATLRKLAAALGLPVRDLTALLAQARRSGGAARG
jgi:transcriptional regulator with XRE-family HTH domain